MSNTPHQDSTPAGAIDPAAELNALAAKREAIKQVIEIGQALERLQESLEAVVQMGKPTRDISAKALRSFEDLNTQTKIMPTEKVVDGLKKLEAAIQQRLDLILALAQGGEEKAARMPDVKQILDEFKRKSQTAVALRILLRERGVPTKPTEISVPTLQLREQMSALEHREQQCRTRIKDDLTGMRKDVERILSSENCPASIRNIVEGVRDEIELNLSYIASGKTIESMPMAIEMVEVGDEPVEAVQRPPAGTEEAVAADQAEAAVETAIETVAGPATKAQVETVEVSRGFFERLFEWLHTPWGHKWSEVPRTKMVEVRRKR